MYELFKRSFKWFIIPALTILSAYSSKHCILFQNTPLQNKM